MKGLYNFIKSNYVNRFGWHTNRKIVVFESDDWGSIRMSSKDAYNALLAKGYGVDKHPYYSYDRIENNDDLDLLANVLLSVKDKNSRPAKFTLNQIMFNPDFSSIQEINFSAYYNESFVETLKRYDDTDKVTDLYKKGKSEGVFQPQLHGREHVNIKLWMDRLQQSEKRALDAFEHKMFALSNTGSVSGRRDNMDAFGNHILTGQHYDYTKIITEAQTAFSSFWGFKSLSFIAPCYTWHPNIEPILKANGIEFLQGNDVQKVPFSADSFKVKKKYHYTGQKNKLRQTYLVRNVVFEPSEGKLQDPVATALQQIELSFKNKKPAIISSHRVNFIGSLVEKNRGDNLKHLQLFLNKIVSKWPDVEFMSSDELGNVINQK